MPASPATEDLTHGDVVFGSQDWRRVADEPSQAKAKAKAGWLLAADRSTVRDAGFAYVLDFTLVDRRGHLLYLIFGTTSPQART